MPFKQDGAISTLNRKPLNLAGHFTYLGGNISSIKIDVNLRTVKAWTIWKSDLSDKIKQNSSEL